MSDDPLEHLGRIARGREAERTRWLDQPGADADLLRPPTAEEQARVLSKVLPPAPAPRPLVPTWAWGLASAATALLVAVLVWGRGGAAALPEYALEVPSLGYSGVRGDPHAGPVLALVPAMALEVVLRPDGAWSEALATRAFVEHDGQRRELAWPAIVAPTGACRWIGEVGREVELPSGRSRLGFVVGRPDRVKAVDLATLDEGSAGVRLRWLEVDVAPR